MPVDQRLGADDCKNLKDRREPAIKLDKEPAIAVCESNTAMQPTPQDNQLMSQHRILSLKPQLRLEWRGQDGQSETEQPDHSTSLGDSVTSSTRMKFSAHTACARRRLVKSHRPKNNHRRRITGIGTPISQSKSPRPMLDLRGRKRPQHSGTEARAAIALPGQGRQLRNNIGLLPWFRRRHSAFHGRYTEL